MNVEYLGQLPAVKLTGQTADVIVPAAEADRLALSVFGDEGVKGVIRTRLGPLHFIIRRWWWNFGEWQEVPLASQFAAFSSEAAARREAAEDRYKEQAYKPQRNIFALCLPSGELQNIRLTCRLCSSAYLDIPVQEALLDGVSELLNPSGWGVVSDDPDDRMLPIEIYCPICYQKERKKWQES